MRALVAHAPGDFRLEERGRPRPREGAVVEVEAAGVCAADRMLWRGDGPWSLRWPFVPGHELLGRISWIDDDTAGRWGVDEGDRVTAEVMVPCGSCPSCRAGRTNLCPSGRHLGSGLPGAFAEALALPPAAVVHRVPEHLSTAAGVMAEPAACAVHCVRRAGLRAGEVVGVAGIGAIGGAVLGMAAGLGARVVAVVNRPERGELARHLGAGEVVDGSAGGGVEQLLELTDRRGPDVFIDCSGSPEAVEVGLRAVAPGGRVVLYGVYRRPATVDLNLLAEHKELDVRGGHLAPGAFPEALELLAAGVVDAERLVTDRHPLERGRDALEPGGPGRVKAVLVPDAEVSSA